MEVRVEETGELSCRLHFVIPAVDINNKLDRRLRELARNSRLPGFRPGKAPMKIIKSRYQDKILQEVALEEMETSYQRAINEHNVDAADHSLAITELAINRDFRFVATVELFPQLDPLTLDNEEIEEYQITITPDDVSKMMDLVRRKHATWKPVQRPARKDDRVYTAFVHDKDARRFLAEPKNSLCWVLGSDGMSQTVTRHLQGAQVDETLVIRLASPPGEQHNEQAQDCEVRVERIEEACLPPLNDDFYKRVGAADGQEQSARTILQEGMQHDIQLRNKRYIHDTLIRRLLEKNGDFAVPPGLLKKEFDRVCSDLKQQFGLDKSNSEFPDEAKIWDQAEKNLRWILIGRRLIAKNQLKPSHERVEEKIRRTAAQYKDPQAAQKYFRQDQQALATIISAVMTEQILDLVLATMKKTPIVCTYGEFIEKTNH